MKSCLLFSVRRCLQGWVKAGSLTHASRVGGGSQLPPKVDISLQLRSRVELRREAEHSDMARGHGNVRLKTNRLPRLERCWGQGWSCGAW